MKKLLVVCSAIVLTYGDCVFAMERGSSGNCNCKSTLQDFQEQISMEKSRRTQAVQSIKMQLSEEKFQREQLEAKLEEKIKDLRNQIDQIKEEKAEGSKEEDSKFKGFALNRHKQTDFGELQSRRGAVAHSREDNRHSELQASEFKGEVVKDGSILKHYRAFPNLKELTISDRDLEYIAKSSLKFPKLEELTISETVDDNNFSALMTLLSKAPNLDVLNIDNAGLSQQNYSELKKFDESASLDPNKVASDLQKLSLEGRKKGKKLLNIKINLSILKVANYIGKDSKKLKKLSKILLNNSGTVRDLDISNIGLEELPESIWDCKQLRILNLNGNQLSYLPESIGNLVNLEELYLAGNKNLRTLPNTVENLKNLRILDVSGCDNAAFWRIQLDRLKSINKNLKIITK